MRSWKTLTACAALALSVAAYGCERTDTRPAEQAQPDPQTDMPRDATPAADTGELKVDEVVANAERYLGQEVTVVGEVDEVLSPRAFSLDEDAPLAAGIDNDLLVLYPKSATLADLDDQWLNDTVRVRGTVGRMTVAEVEQEVGWDLDAKLEAEIEKQRPILIARSVDRVQ